jgi:hypothetical protein
MLILFVFRRIIPEHVFSCFFLIGKKQFLSRVEPVSVIREWAVPSGNGNLVSCMELVTGYIISQYNFEEEFSQLKWACNYDMHLNMWFVEDHSNVGVQHHDRNGNGRLLTTWHNQVHRVYLWEIVCFRGKKSRFIYTDTSEALNIKGSRCIVWSMLVLTTLLYYTFEESLFHLHFYTLQKYKEAFHLFGCTQWFLPSSPFYFIIEFIIKH